jgi:addiction module HigA family antidote
MRRPAIHPGEILAGELAELGVTPTELARQIGVPPNRLSQIIQGKRSVTGDTALRLSAIALRLSSVRLRSVQSSSTRRWRKSPSPAS